MLADLVEVVFEDNGDGSILATLIFENETEHTFDPMIPYEGKVVYKENDNFTEGTYYDESGEEL